MNKIKNLALPAVIVVGLISFGCEKKPANTVTVTVPADSQPVSETKTLETAKLGAAVDSYLAAPTAENSADVKKAAADLDGEIAELEARVAKTTGDDKAEAQAKLMNLQTYRTQEMARFAAGGPNGSARSGSDKVEDSMDKAGDEIKEGAEKTGNAIEDAAKKVGNSLENAAEKVGDKVHDATH